MKTMLEAAKAAKFSVTALTTDQKNAALEAMAQALLARGESVSAAGEAAGFSDYANFIRSFKKQTGMSPGQYRKKYGA